jgi:Ca2+-binding EF-hand superfamily protein
MAGFIAVDEHCAVADILDDPVKLKEVVKAAFDGIDTDKSGFVEATELKNVMKIITQDNGVDPPTDADLQDAMEWLDKNGDGKLSLDELTQLVKDVLESMCNDMNK